VSEAQGNLFDSVSEKEKDRAGETTGEIKAEKNPM
jgi:hypothetical protein